MKHLIAATILLTSLQAFAVPRAVCDNGQHVGNPHCASNGGTTGTTVDTSPRSTALVQQQGQAQSQTAIGGSASQSSVNSNSNSAISSNSSVNSNINSNVSSAAGNTTSVNVQGGSVTYEAQARNPVATAYSAPLVASNGTCFGSASGGLQSVGIGLSFGTTKLDEGCDARYDSMQLAAMGLRDAAIARMCQREENRRAIESSGGVCPTREQ